MGIVTGIVETQPVRVTVVWLPVMPQLWFSSCSITRYLQPAAMSLCQIINYSAWLQQFGSLNVVLMWNCLISFLGELPRVPRESVLQIARMMTTRCLKVLKIGPLTPSRCLRLLRELPLCTSLRKLGIELLPTHIQVPMWGMGVPLQHNSVCDILDAPLGIIVALFPSHACTHRVHG